jgi:DNA-binding transcriptional regulator GbsR (MarR family)
MHEESREPQNIIEDFVQSVISALERPMFSREIAEFLGISPGIVGNALKVASGYGLASKVAPFNEKRQIWVRAEGDAYADALAAWEVRSKQRPIQTSQPSLCETPTSSSINEDFWNRWLRNDPSTRPKLDD